LARMAPSFSSCCGAPPRLSWSHLAQR
jgi:hypothetical protein